MYHRFWSILFLYVGTWPHDPYPKLWKPCQATRALNSFGAVSLLSKFGKHEKQHKPCYMYQNDSVNSIQRRIISIIKFMTLFWQIYHRGPASNQLVQSPSWVHLHSIAINQPVRRHISFYRTPRRCRSLNVSILLSDKPWGKLIVPPRCARTISDGHDVISYDMASKTKSHGKQCPHMLNSAHVFHSAHSSSSMIYVSKSILDPGLFGHTVQGMRCHARALMLT